MFKGNGMSHAHHTSEYCERGEISGKLDQLSREISVKIICGGERIIKGPKAFFGARFNIPIGGRSRDFR